MHNNTETESRGTEDYQGPLTSSLGNMPGFTEFRKQVENEGPEGVDENKAFLKENHPQLYEEMVRNDVPMDPNEFKQQGYKFGRDENGDAEVWYPTEEYKEYLAGEGERPRRQYVAEQEKNDYEATKKIKEYVKSNYRWVTGSGHEPNEYEVGRITKEVSNILPFITGSDEQIKTLIGEAVREGIEQQDLRPDAKSIYESLIMDSFDRVNNGHWREPDDAEIKQQANDQYEEALEGGIDDILEHRIDERISKLRDDPNSRYWQNSYKIADRIANTIVRQRRDNAGLTPEEEDRVRQVAERIVEELSEENKKQIGKEIADKKSVHYWVDKIAESPQAVEEIFTKYGIDRCDLGKFDYSELIREYSDYNTGDREKTMAGKKEIVIFFNLSERLKEDFMKDGGVGFGMRRDGSLYARGKRYNVLDDRLSSGIRQEIREAELRFAEKMKDEEALRGAIAEAREKYPMRIAKNVLDNLSNSANNGEEVGFDFYLSKGTEIFYPDLSREVREEVEKTKRTELLGDFMSTDKICESLGLEPEPIEIEYKEILKTGLMQRLREGARWDRNFVNRWVYMPLSTEIFDTDGFRENQERLEIDLSDLEVAKNAFDGFINILQTTNGPESEEASWYYDNIFANNPKEFLAMVASYKESDVCSRGDKTRLTRFFNKHQLAEVTRRSQEEINAEQHLVKSSIMQNIPKEEFKEKLNEYVTYLLQRKDKNTKNIGLAFEDTYMVGSGFKSKAKEAGGKVRHERPFDFALDKVRCFGKYESFIGQNIADGEVERFSTAFASDMDYNKMYRADNSFVGIEFKYGDKWCAIAESIGATGSMYVFRGDEKGEYLEMFEDSRSGARRSDDPRFVAIDHLDTEHFDDSLDLTYKKALWFLKSGDKRVRSYYAYDDSNDSAKGRRKWEKGAKEALPAWPMGVDGAKISAVELARYQAWQKEQMDIKDRLVKAKEQGGAEGYRREQELIAREAYEKALEETAEEVS